MFNSVNSQFCFALMPFVEWEENKVIVDHYFSLPSENISMTGELKSYAVFDYDAGC